MRAFDSIAKKLAIPMVVLFEIGWIIYTGGFGSYIHQEVLRVDRSGSRYSSYDQSPRDANEVLRDPTLYSHYFALVGGQFVAILFLLHAALPSITASYVIGVLSSILNVIYFVSVGFLIHWSVNSVRHYEDRIRTLQESPYPSYSSYSESSSEALERVRLYLHAVRCVLAGTIMMTISWGVIQLLTFFYKPQTDSQNKTNLWQVVREFARKLPTSTSQMKAKLGELIRLSTIPLLVLSAVGWAVCTAGLYRLSDISSAIVTHQYDFGTWAIFFVTPILYFGAVFHAGCSGGASTMSGVFAAIFNVFFVLNLGSRVIGVCITKYIVNREQISRFSAEETRRALYNSDLALGGGVVCLFFWTIIYAFWHFYSFDRSIDHGRLRSNGDPEHSQSIVHAEQNEYGDTTATHSSFVPGQQVPPPYAKHLESEMQPVAN
jgi:hypothetical protein